jgi:hypothetical protein
LKRLKVWSAVKEPGVPAGVMPSRDLICVWLKRPDTVNCNWGVNAIESIANRLQVRERDAKLTRVSYGSPSSVPPVMPPSPYAPTPVTLWSGLM